MHTVSAAILQSIRKVCTLMKHWQSNTLYLVLRRRATQKQPWHSGLTTSIASTGKLAR